MSMAEGLVQAVGWALVHFLWQGALIALVMISALSVCRGAKARYGAACAAMLVLLATFGVTLSVSIPDPRTLGPRPWAVGSAVAGSAGKGLIGATPGLLARIQGAIPWVAPFWMAGALMLGLYRLGGWMAAQRMRRTGVCDAPPAWRRRLSQLAHRINVPMPVALLESSLAEVPVVIGCLRPVILIPAGLLAGLPAAQVEAILLHELAHIRRFDYLLNLMQTLVESLLYYHPAVW